MTEATRDVPLTETWSQLSLNGATEFSATLEGNRSSGALVRIAAAQPASAVTTGHRLSALTPSMQLANIGANLKVWGRAVSNEALLCVS